VRLRGGSADADGVVDDVVCAARVQLE
jgi:hypothetical protein